MVKKDKKETNLVRSVNKNIRSSTRKLNPILKGIVGKKVDLAIRDLDFSNKRICKDIKKVFVMCFFFLECVQNCYFWSVFSDWAGITKMKLFNVCS